MFRKNYCQILIADSAGIYLFKAKANCRTIYETGQKLTERNQDNVTDVVWCLFLLTFNIFHTLFWCFYY